MSEVNNVNNVQNTRFQRDTKVDYSKGDPVINSAFAMWDINKNGSFEDSEWDLYQQYCNRVDERNQRIEQLNNQGLVDFYEKKAQAVCKKLEKIEHQLCELSNNFNEILAFEEKHGLYRTGLGEGEKPPKGAEVIDVSSFEMGIPESEEYFSGQTYQRGYVLGLEKLNEAEREQYFEMIKEYQEVRAKYDELYSKRENLQTQFDDLIALSDMAQAGYIPRVLSEQNAVSAVQQYRRIMSESNPHKERINTLESRIALLAAKINRTEAEDIELMKSRSELSQLRVISSMYSISDIQKDVVIKFGEGIHLTNASLETSVQINNQNNNERPNPVLPSKLAKNGEVYPQQMTSNTTDPNTTTTLSFGAVASSSNFIGEASATLTNKNDISTSISGTYARDLLSIRVSSNMNESGETTILANSVAMQQNNLGVSYQRVDTFLPKPDDEGEDTEEFDRTPTSSTVTLTSKNGIFNSNLSLNWGNDGTTWNAESATSFNYEPVRGLNLNIDPSIGLGYHVQNHIINPQVNISGMMMYNTSDVTTSINMSNQYSLMTKHGQKPKYSNTFNTAATVSYKSLEGSFSITNSDNNNSNDTTLGGGIRVRTNHNVTVGVQYFWTVTKSKSPWQKDSSSSNLTVSVTVPLH